MKRLSYALANLAEALAPEQRRKLADAFRTAAPGTLEAVVDQAWTPSDAAFEALKKEVKSELRREPDVSGAALAFALRTADNALELRKSRTEELELVWSGPKPQTVSVRQTEQALCGLVNEARKKLFLVSFVVYKPKIVFDALKDAHDRGVEISILRHRISGEDGDGVSFQDLQKTFPRAKIYQRRDFDPDNKRKKLVHAKCAVADNSVAFVTSANLSDQAMAENMELGVLIRGGGFPKRLHEFLDALVTEKIVVPY